MYRYFYELWIMRVQIVYRDLEYEGVFFKGEETNERTEVGGIDICV